MSAIVHLQAHHPVWENVYIKFGLMMYLVCMDASIAMPPYIS
jgi:hypothetical protein